MRIFSQEYLDKLKDELQLVNLTITKMRIDSYYNHTYGVQTASGALANLHTKKIELEAMIDTLGEHLNG